MFDVKIALCLISVDFYKDEKYVLSLSPDKISFPTFDIANANNLSSQAISSIVSCFQDQQAIRAFANNVQFISINDENSSKIFDCTNSIYLFYGTTLPNLEPNINLFWKRFDFIDESIINELAIIGDTIERAI
jgi:hypothetical protein